MTNEEGLIKVKSVPAQSNTLGAVGATLGGAALAGVVANGVGNMFSRYLGNIGNNIGALTGVTPVAAPMSIPMYGQAYAPMIPPAYSPACAPPAVFEGGYVTKEVAALLAENGQLKAEKYTDISIKEAYKEFFCALGETNKRVCELEKREAVNAAHDIEYRNYVENCLVHQPRVHFDNRTIKTVDGCCDPCSH